QSRELIRFVQGTIESIQAAIKTYLKLPCSFIAASQPCSWEELPETLDRFSVLFASGLGTGSEMLLTDRPALGASGRQERVKINRIHLLGSYLDRKEQERFYALFDDIMESVPVHFGVQTGIALEVFYSLTAIFSGYLNRRNLFDEISPHINMKQLYAIQEHASWPKATAFFRLLAALIFAYSDNANERETNEVIRKLHDYMDSHLDEPLSLNQLSEVVYLTSSYLSRLYKQKTGHSITDSITTRKITEAKRLLTETNRKIQEIGEQIGYGSPSYFSRFFKRETEMTPQEYRDAFRST
ncbi:AraC family transcriptional regulator, partial [Paenibacillus sepulcri]|nr:AraC family transcriptional regulator [Paenibacillus sepulcri]